MFPLLAAFQRVPAHNFAEQALLIVEQRQVALLELLEKLLPRNLDQALVLGLLVVGEHDADDAHISGCFLQS